VQTLERNKEIASFECQGSDKLQTNVLLTSLSPVQLIKWMAHQTHVH